MITTLVDWWRRTRLTSPRLRTTIWITSRSELPNHLSRRHAYAIGQPDTPKWLILACPCGRGHQLEVNLDPSQNRPTWHLVETLRGPAVTPSIDSVGARHRCHFWIRNGRITWT